MSISEDVSDFIRERTLVEMVKCKRDERMYNPEEQFSKMGISEEAATWIAKEVESQFKIPLMPLLRRKPLGIENYNQLSPQEITNYVIGRIN